MAKKGKYVPYTEADWKRWYPGQISEARKKQLAELCYQPTELTGDDVVYLLSQGYITLMHGMMKAMKKVVGDEATKKIMYEYGLSRGRLNMKRMLGSLGTADPSPEQWAWFQDSVHAGSGIEHSQAHSDYDEEKCVVKRTHCGMLGNDPETRQYCKYIDMGALDAYMEAQPTIEARLPKSMIDGDDHCEHVFTHKAKKK